MCLVLAQARCVDDRVSIKLLIASIDKILFPEYSAVEFAFQADIDPALSIDWSSIRLSW